MNTQEFLHNFINPLSHKVKQNHTEYTLVKTLDNIKVIKATTFYQIYKHNVFNKTDKRLSMKEFFHVCGQYFYYDKYVCEHGTEFYYHVLFNEDNDMYKITKSIIDKKIRANRPDKLKDLKYVVPALSKPLEVQHG